MWRSICAMTGDVTTDPTWQTMPARRPWLGLLLLGISVAGTLAILIYFGAWFADNRIEARGVADDETGQVNPEGEWWEDGLISICPVH